MADESVQHCLGNSGGHRCGTHPNMKCRACYVSERGVHRACGHLCELLSNDVRHAAAEVQQPADTRRPVAGDGLRGESSAAPIAVTPTGVEPHVGAEVDVPTGERGSSTLAAACSAARIGSPGNGPLMREPSMEALAQ